ncbi:unnamed protein product, partial [Brassica oleracea]
NYYTSSRKHTTNSFIHIPSPTLHPVDQLSHDIYNHNNDTKIIIGLRLDRSKLVRLTIWDNEAANFRELNHIFTRKNQS